MCEDPDYWLVTGEGGESLVGWLAWYAIFFGGLDFPAPWLSGRKKQRKDMVEAIEASAVTVLPITEIKAAIKGILKYSAECKLDPARAIDEFLDSDGQVGANPLRNWPVPSVYLMRVNFPFVGSEAVVRSLDSWARKEAKKFPRRRLAKAAEPPFDRLKWLAAWRLEAARREVGVSFEDVQAVLKEHERRRHVVDSSPVLPIYASHGAWSKAKRDAQTLLRRFEAEPKAFEKEVFLC